MLLLLVFVLLLVMMLFFLGPALNCQVESTNGTVHLIKDNGDEGKISFGTKGEKLQLKTTRHMVHRKGAH